MDKQFLNNTIDIERLIEKRLLEIESLEERKEAREILGQIFKEIYKYADNTINVLRQDISEEMKYQQDAFVISTGVASTKTYDITEGSLFPMKMEDLEERYISTKELMQELSKGNDVRIFSVFFELDYQSIRRLVEQRRVFTGYINTINAEYPVTVELRPATRYYQMLTQLFKVFVNNGMPWNTVCTAYLSKFLDVYIRDAQIPVEEEIESIIIEFNEYEPKVKYDYFPVWNIKEEVGVSEVIKTPCFGQVLYQHTIAKKGNNEDAYLVVDTEDILSIKKNTNEIVFNSTVSESKKWILYHITKDCQGFSEYPIWSNDVKSDNAMPARTRGDIFRVVNSLSNNSQLALSNVLFPETYQCKVATYSMEKGITEEYDNSSDRLPLVLQFSCLKQDFLTIDIMSYIVTVVQRKYPEFSCYGELIKE